MDKVESIAEKMKRGLMWAEATECQSYAQCMQHHFVSYIHTCIYIYIYISMVVMVTTCIYEYQTQRVL